MDAGSNTGNVARDESVTTERIRVWDWGVRLGHWLLVVAFFTIYYKSRKFPLHAYGGYLIFAIILWRFVWGFVGTKYARFSSFIYSPREILTYSVAAFRLGHAKEYLSHNPMGSIMVFVLLFGVLANCILGVLLYSAQELSGPLGELVPTVWEEWLEPAHTLLADTLVACIGLHVLGVLWATWWHRENYLKAMITGDKCIQRRRDHLEPVDHDRRKHLS